MITQNMLNARIPCTDVIAPLGCSVDMTARVFLCREKQRNIFKSNGSVYGHKKQKNTSIISHPVGKITEKAICRSVFLTLWHCILSAESTKTHSFRYTYLQLATSDFLYKSDYPNYATQKLS